MKKTAAALSILALFVVLGVVVTVGRVGIPSVEAASGTDFAVVQCVRTASPVSPISVLAFSASAGVTTTPTANSCAQTLADLTNNDRLKLTFAVVRRSL